jgi:predicted O-methyltransferase YrrM
MPAVTYEAPDGRTHQMNFHEPHRELEAPEQEIAVIDAALAALVDAGILPHARYDHAKMLAHRDAVRERMEIPWTAITLRMQRLMYAINAILQPQVMVAVGIFCGNTFMSNAGAAIGPGAVYAAKRLFGLEIRTEEADRARRNVEQFRNGDGRFPAEILGQDGTAWLHACEASIDLLYLDADGFQGQGKSIYLKMLLAAEHCLHSGSVILAHNSVNCAEGLADYLAYVRGNPRFRLSANMIVDDQGLEVTLV